MSSRAAVIGFVMVAVASLAACTSSGSGNRPAAARVGAQYVAIAGHLTGHLTGRTSTLQTVQGRLDVRVGEPRSSIVEVGSAERVQPAGGGSFVEMEFEPGPEADAPRVGTPAYPTLRAWLVADGRAYPIDLDSLHGQRNGADDHPADDAMRAGTLPFGATYLAVAGRPKTLAVRIRQDARTQSVDVRTGRRDTGGAADLYNDPRPATTHSCGRQRNPARIVPAYRPCTISYARTPWVGGKGYAPAGKAWLVARINIGTNTGVEVEGSDGDAYELDTGPQLTFTWPAGAVARVGINEDPKYSDEDADVAFLVPADTAAGATLTITATYVLRDLLGDAEPPPGVRTGQAVPVSWRTEVR